MKGFDSTLGDDTRADERVCYIASNNGLHVAVLISTAIIMKTSNLPFIINFNIIIVNYKKSVIYKSLLLIMRVGHFHTFPG